MVLSVESAINRGGNDIQMNILLIEPYYTGSHASWAEGYKKYSHHNVEILSLKGQFWKWRMHGGAITLARKFFESDVRYDLILTTDMLDLTIFQSLTRKQTHNIPYALYFHENQLAYPWSETDRDVVKNRDRHYSFINYSSALAADQICFNSQFHMDIFFVELRRFLKGFPDNNELRTVEELKMKSSVLSLGLDLTAFDQFETKGNSGKPLILWNHRWEYDKNPDDFFDVLYKLDESGLDFEVIVAGENFSQKPAKFLEAKERLGSKIVQFGYVADFSEYAKWLWKADIVPVTSNQDFFSISSIQAMYCNCYPLIPNRLAFPEHIHPEYHNEFIYNDIPDLTKKLEYAVQNIEQTRARKVAQFACNYRWEQMSSVYDTLFESCIKQ